MRHLAAFFLCPGFPLVPKLYLGTHLFAKLHFALFPEKYNFEDWGVPKYNLGTRKTRKGLVTIRQPGMTVLHNRISLLLQVKTIHHYRLVNLPIGVVAADVGKDEDLAVLGLYRVRIVG